VSLNIYKKIITIFYSRIKFVVVAEPPEDQQQQLECVDIGYATVNAKQLLRDETDCIEQFIDGRISIFEFLHFFSLFIKFIQWMMKKKSLDE